MQNLLTVTNEIVSQYVEKATLEAMERLLDQNSLENNLSGACVIAENFDSAETFKILTSSAEESTKAETKLIQSFHNNLKLLVQKTWVEKSDIAVKEHILYQLDPICDSLRNKDYIDIYPKYIKILQDVVYLMFGSQSKKEEFAEYALRIDPGFGIFWWYLVNMPSTTPPQPETARIYLLLGMLFLANY
jgi:hypothetical protein